MAIIVNDNLAVNTGKPVDSKYLNISAPWASISAVNAAIPSSYRYTGLTVNILGVDYWYKDGIGNSDLVEKKYGSAIPSDDLITGATNIGYFSGKTGIQTLPLVHGGDPNITGSYNSLYNYFYRDTNGYICIGTPTDGILRRGYVKTAAPVKSWIWNEYTGGTDLLGWATIANSIEDQLGTYQDSIMPKYYNGITTYPYTETGWTTGVAYNNGSLITISTVRGSLTTGSTYNNGGTIFAEKEGNLLDFKTIVSATPTMLTVTSDNTFVYLSGNTGLIEASNGLTKTGDVVTLGGTLTATTTITDSRAVPVGIQYGGNYTATFTSRSLVDKGYVDGIGSVSGERIVKTICKSSHGYNVNCVVGWSGGTYNLSIANGTYDGEVLGLVTKCYNTDCFELTMAGFTTGLTGLVTNTTYFLSDTYYGCLTCVEPTSPNYLSKAMLIANSTTSGWVLPYAAYIISSGVSEGGPLIKSVCIAPNSYQIQTTDFFVGVNGGSFLSLPISPKLGMVIVVADVSNSAFTYNINILGALAGGQSVSLINTDSGSMTYLYNGTTWNVIAFSPSLA